MMAGRGEKGEGGKEQREGKLSETEINCVLTSGNSIAELLSVRLEPVHTDWMLQ